MNAQIAESDAPSIASKEPAPRRKRPNFRLVEAQRDRIDLLETALAEHEATIADYLGKLTDARSRIAGYRKWQPLILALGLLLGALGHLVLAKWGIG